MCSVPCYGFRFITKITISLGMLLAENHRKTDECWLKSEFIVPISRCLETASGWHWFIFSVGSPKFQAFPVLLLYHPWHVVSHPHDGDTAAVAECFVTFEGPNWQMVGGLARPMFLDIKGCLPNVWTKWGISCISNGRICQNLHLLTPKPLHLPLSCDDSVLRYHPIPQYIHPDSVIWPIFHSTSDRDPIERIAESLF